MTYITQLVCRKAMFSSRILTMMLAGFVLVVLQASTVEAQWTTTGTNISNSNTGNVGVGTTTSAPSERLSVLVQDAVSNGVTRVLSIGHTTTGIPAAGLGSGLTFRAKRSDGVLASAGYIAGIWEDPTNGIEDGALVFAPLLNSSGFGTERMRISSSGNVGIGTTSPGTSLDVSGNIITIGSEAGTTARANNTTKLARVAMPPFASASLKFALLGAATTSTANIAAFGGEVGGMAAATQIDFVTAATNNVDTGTIRMTVNSAGNVGIGTTSPGAKLHVNAGGTTALLLGADTEAPSYNVVSLNGSVSDAGHLGLAGGGGTDKTLYVDTPTGGAINFRVNTSSKLIIDTSGNVGIGTTSPTAKLHVTGDGRLTGNLTVDGNIAAKYQDVAEWVESSQILSAGTVVVLDQTKSNQVIASSQAYDTRVAGVISSQPGITLGASGAGKVLVATTGRVRIKVDASSGSIQVGDLLVTSDVAGVAMKSQPLSLGGVQIHRPGTLIGKALEPLPTGTGEILVLLSLQ